MEVQLTSAETYVLGGLGDAMFVKFVATASAAFLLLREHSKSVIPMIAKAVTSVPPNPINPFKLEEHHVEAWLNEALRVNESHANAARHFVDTLRRSLQSNTCCCCRSSLHIWGIDVAANASFELGLAQSLQSFDDYRH